jgi:hypothetical protein
MPDLPDPTRPREWDIRELAAGDALRRDSRVVHRIPAPPPPTWADITADRTTRHLLRELNRVGFEPRGVHDGHAYLQIGSTTHLVVLSVSDVDPTVVVSVRYGRREMTPADAVGWLECFPRIPR